MWSRISPDGKRLVINLTRQTQDDIVIIDGDGMNRRNLTNDKYFDRCTVWIDGGKKQREVDYEKKKEK